jgi:hypothetical protein
MKSNNTLQNISISYVSSSRDTIRYGFLDTIRAFLVSSGLAHARGRWHQCVAPAKNNFICVFIVKRAKRMRDTGRCAGCYPAAVHPNA